MPDVQVSKQVQLLDGVLGPQMRRIADNLRAAGAAVPTTAAAAVGGGGNEGVDAAGTEVAAGIGAMANVSKGFNAVVAAEVEARFFQVGGWVGREEERIFPRKFRPFVGAMFSSSSRVVCGEGGLCVSRAELREELPWMEERREGGGGWLVGFQSCHRWCTCCLRGGVSPRLRCCLFSGYFFSVIDWPARSCTQVCPNNTTQNCLGEGTERALNNTKFVVRMLSGA